MKKKFKNNSTFQSNISRYHRDIQLTDFKSLLLPEQKVEPLWLDQGDTDEVIPDIHENSDQSTKDTSQEKTDHEKPFLESLALLYLKLQAKFFYSSINHPVIMDLINRVKWTTERLA